MARWGLTALVLVLTLTPPLATAAATPVAAAEDSDAATGTIYRYYRGILDREPEADGFGYWHCATTRGRIGLVDVADAFVDSPEFVGRYGSLEGADFLERAYRNLFGRSPDAEGERYWLELMAQGQTPGHVLAHLTGSEEFRAITSDGTPPALDPARQGSETCGDVVVAWVAGGLPAGFSSGVAEIDAVREHTVVHGDLAPLRSTHDAEGTAIDVAPGSWAYPLDALAVDPVAFASFQEGPGADVIARLQPGQAVLTETSARVRRIGVGSVMTFAGGAVTVAGIVDDPAGAGAEVLFHRADGPRLGVTSERFVLVRDRARAQVEGAIRELLDPGDHLTLRGSEDDTYLRHGGNVTRQARIKEVFGEFLFQDAGGRAIRLDPAWEAANIATTSVPLLGTVRCHRAIIPNLRAALAEVEARGYGYTVNPADYAGCYNPRRIGPGQGLSRHSWGVALDINIRGNARGDFSTQHPVLIEAMAKEGFLWGGRWDYPDPGHHEARR